MTVLLSKCGREPASDGVNPRCPSGNGSSAFPE
jgi:hypothetical protein